jgi:biotin carboxyl carrier protein
MADIKVTSDLVARVWQIEVEAGARVDEGDTLIVLESMKMEIPVSAPQAGVVREILVAKEDTVEEGQTLVLMSA